MAAPLLLNRHRLKCNFSPTELLIKLINTYKHLLNLYTLVGLVHGVKEGLCEGVQGGSDGAGGLVSGKHLP